MSYIYPVFTGNYIEIVNPTRSSYRDGVKMAIIIQKFSFHSISVTETAPVARVITGRSEDVEKYLEHILREATTPPKNQENIRGQYFKFKNTSERVAANLKAIVLDSTNAIWDEKVIDNAIKLLDVEKNTQERIAQLGNIRKGCLLQVKCKIEDELTIILVKIDDKTFLEETDMQLKRGLPLDTRVQKLAIIKFDASGKDTSLLLSDTNSTLSQYWRDDFFVVDPIRDSKKNTINAFNEINKVLTSQIKKSSPQDYVFIRNEITMAFRQESLNFDDLVEKLKTYEPLSEKITEQKYTKFIKELEKLPNDLKKGFDTQFEIAKDEIKARMLVNKMVIDEHFELKITGDVPDLQNKFGKGKEEDGRKFVKIYSEKGYDKFDNNFADDDESS